MPTVKVVIGIDNFPQQSMLYGAEPQSTAALKNLCVKKTITAEHFIQFFSHLESKWAFSKIVINSYRNTVIQVER